MLAAEDATLLKRGRRICHPRRFVVWPVSLQCNMAVLGKTRPAGLCSGRDLPEDRLNVARQTSRPRHRLDQRHRPRHRPRARQGRRRRRCINGFGDPAAIEDERAGIEREFGVKALLQRRRHGEAGRDRGDGRRRRRRNSVRSTFSSTTPASSSSRRSRISRSEKWDAIIAINLSSAFHAIRAAVPGMKAQKWGRIVNTASAHSLVASPFKAAYVAAKHGLDRPHQDGRARARDLRRHRQLHLARLCLDAAGREPDPRHDEGAQPDARAGDQRRDAGARSRPSSSSPSTRSPRSRSFSAPTPPRRSPARTSRSTAVGRRSRAAGDDAGAPRAP